MADDEQDPRDEEQLPRIGRPEPQILPPVSLRGINVPMPGAPEYGAADAGSHNDLNPTEEQQPRIGRPEAANPHAIGRAALASPPEEQEPLIGRPQAQTVSARGITPETAPPFVGPQALRRPTAIPQPENLAPTAAPTIAPPAIPPPVFQPPSARPIYTGGSKAMGAQNISDATKAAQDARSVYAANPTPENKQAFDRAELARKQISGSGISQIGNPVLRTIARVGDIAGSIAFPRFMPMIPGTTAHHNLQVGAGQGTVGKDVEEEAKQAEAEAKKNPPGRYVTPRQGGGIFSADENRWVVPPTPTSQKESPTDQRKDFADANRDMFQDDNERRNFVLYGHAPQKATANPNEWQTRIDAANGDKNAQRVLAQRFGEEKTLAGIRGTAGTNAKASAKEDQANAEVIASKILNSAGGDPDKALQMFDQHSPNITDPEQKRLGPEIRKAIRARKQINRPDPMQEWLNQMPQAQEQP